MAGRPVSRHLWYQEKHRAPVCPLSVLSEFIEGRLEGEQRTDDVASGRPSRLEGRQFGDNVSDLAQDFTLDNFRQYDASEYCCAAKAAETDEENVGGASGEDGFGRRGVTGQEGGLEGGPGDEPAFTENLASSATSPNREREREKTHSA